MNTRFVAYSCRHSGHHDPEAIDWLCGVIEAEKPDVVVDLGDAFEADAASRFPSEQNHTLLDEMDADDKVRRQIREAAGGADLWQCMGNHDWNIIDQGRIDPKVRDLCDWRRPIYTPLGNRINPEIDHWSVRTEYRMCRARGVCRIGQVTFGHGWDASKFANARQSVLLGCPYGLAVFGHTHRPQAVERAMWSSTPLPYWSANAGTMRDMDPHYMERASKFRWGQACVVGEANPNAGPSKSPRMSRHWEAETRVRCMYDEWADAKFRGK